MTRGPEDVLEDQVLEAAGTLGWLRFHPRPARTKDGKVRTAMKGDKGFPDLTLAHRTRGTIFVELKSDVGKLSPEQELWRDVLLAGGQEWHLWRPRDWYTLIVPRLKGQLA